MTIIMMMMMNYLYYLVHQPFHCLFKFLNFLEKAMHHSFIVAQQQEINFLLSQKVVAKACFSVDKEVA